MMVSSIGLRRLTYSRTIEPATFKASTALLWETSDTSASFTLRMQSFTLQDAQHDMKTVINANHWWQVLVFAKASLWLWETSESADF